MGALSFTCRGAFIKLPRIPAVAADSLSGARHDEHSRIAISLTPPARGMSSRLNAAGSPVTAGLQA